MTGKTPNQTNNNGFTLVELMIALAISGIVSIAIVTAYQGQTRANTTHRLHKEMQQQLNGAMIIMKHDICMAGYRGLDRGGPVPGLTVTNANTLRFTFYDPVRSDDDIDNDSDGITDEVGEKDNIDNDGDGDVDEDREIETVEYVIIDTDGDGTQEILRRLREADNGNSIRRSNRIASNIEALEFAYPDASTVQVTILARTSELVDGHLDTAVYTSPSGTVWGPFNDNFQRRMLTSSVFCRNIGL